MSWVFWFSLLFTIWFVVRHRKLRLHASPLPTTIDNQSEPQPTPDHPEPVHYIHRAPPVQHRTTPPLPYRAPAPFEIRQMEEQQAMWNDVQSRRAPKASPLSDPQNVHDSTVVKSLKASLTRLPEPHLSVSEALTRAREICKNNRSALQTLYRMESNTIPLLSLGMREAEVLQKVVSAIGNDKDKEEMFVLELQNATDDNACASGRVARVVGTLCVLDDRVSILPTWALKRELLNTASTLNTHDEDVIKTALYKQYAEPGLATKQFIDGEVASWGL